VATTHGRWAFVGGLASIEVATDGEQRGLLGHTVIDGVRYAAWTQPGTDHLVVGALGNIGNGGNGGAPATVERIVWDAGGTAGGAVGGHLAATADGKLVLGIGQLTDWAKWHGSGAMLLLDPAGPPEQTPIVLSGGYINPFASAAVGDQLWVADNAGDSLGPCLTGATVLADGTIVTATADGLVAIAP